SQSARQIGQRQAKYIEQFMASLAKPDSEENEEEETPRKFAEDDDDAPELPQFEKPTVLAMNEMKSGIIRHHYKE
ncbi:MAG: hypothetical protein ABH878_10485, partial [bacterium]